MKRISLSNQLFLTLTLLISLSILAASCKKETNPPTTNNVQGLWIGSYQNTTTPAANFTMSIKADGTVTHEGMAASIQHFSSGTWTLTGTNFTASTTCIYGWSGNIGVKQFYTATFDPSTGTLSSGTWANIYPPAAVNSGTFILTKVK